MNIGSAQSGDSWAAFQRLADAARVRNGGFDIPVTRQAAQPSPARPAMQVQRAPRPEAAEALLRLSQAYTQKEQAQPQRVLGTNFDSYA